MKKTIILIAILLSFTANAQQSSELNDSNKVYSFSTTSIWRICGDYEPVYYIKVLHPTYNEVVYHNFKLSDLQRICEYAKKLDSKESIHKAEFVHKTNNNKIHFKTGVQGKKRRVVLVFNDTRWIHGFSVDIRLDKLAKWIGVELT